MMLEHTALHTFVHVQSAVGRAFRMLSHMAVLDNISQALDFNRSASGQVHITSTNPRLVPKSMADALQFSWNAIELLMHLLAGNDGASKKEDIRPSRRLLFAEVAASVERALVELDSLRESYANQVAEVFSYRYADVDTAATRAAWLYDMGPDAPAAAIRRNPCQLFSDILQLFRHGFEGLGTALRDRSKQATPARTLAEAWTITSPTPVSDQQPAPSSSVSAALINGILAAFRVVGVAPSSVHSAIEAVVRELRQSVTCDYLAVQTCSAWRVQILHGVVIVGVWFAAWFVLCGVLGINFIAVLTMPAFLTVLMSVSYGYSWSCLPMVPVCLFEDTHSAWRTFLPRQMAVPDALLFDSEICQRSRAHPPSQCIRKCEDPPLAYTSWYSPAAWLAAEAGLVELEWLRWVPIVDRDALELELQVRAALVADADQDLKTANRICTFFSMHLLIPYVLLAFIVLIMANALLRSLAAIFYSTVLTVCMLFASASTEDEV